MPRRKTLAMLLAGMASLAAASPAMAQQAPTASQTMSDAVQTQRLMLSGHGPKDAVPWHFKIDSGRRAGEDAMIPVPSNWQQQGFGTYQYGLQLTDRRHAHGVYKRSFVVPADWKGRRVRIVFNGVMTDTKVMVNGKPAGPIHQGGYYRFGYDITDLVTFGKENEVTVDVAEASSDPDTENAERIADYWDFSGIFRPVWLESTPMQSIADAAIDAKANGDLNVDVSLRAPRDVTRVEGQVVDADGKPVGAPFSTRIPAGGAGKVHLSTRIDHPLLWNAETPNLYSLDLGLYRGDTLVHHIRDRFGFRTFEVRPGKGLYLNGQRILLAGVNRHSFRPDTARTLSREDNYDDVRLIKAMHMNAVRMSHYPPNVAFLEAADELGLYVLDELSGWQHAHGDKIGHQLVREMVTRDVNHPSILFWDNGNEGGFNRDLDGDFGLYDPQNRRVLHPWELHDDVDTSHYPDYPKLTRLLDGPNLVMPTEFMHALYDGGGGAGFDDYWSAIKASPVGAGGFIWGFADEGIARTDRGGKIDNYATYAPDGVVGPNHEPEPSFFTLQDILSPVQIETPKLDAQFDGHLRVANDYDFTALDTVAFDWQLIDFAGPQDTKLSPRVLASGSARASAAPHASGDLAISLPADWRRADALVLTAKRDGKVVHEWTWPVQSAARATEPVLATAGPAASVSISRSGDTVRLNGGDVVASFDRHSGLLRKVTLDGKAMAVSDGPRLVAIGPRTDEEPDWTPTTRNQSVFRPAKPTLANLVDVKLNDPRREGWSGFKLEISSDGKHWRTLYDGKRKVSDPTRYLLAPERIAAVRVTNLISSRDAPVSIENVRLGYQPKRFPDLSRGKARIRTGTETDPQTGARRLWLEAKNAGGLDSARWTLTGSGVLALDYRYHLSGRYRYFGITFDSDLAALRSVTGLVSGPRPVWQNRLRGTMPGAYRLAASDDESLPIPQRAGYFEALRWARFDGSAGQWLVASAKPQFLRIGDGDNDFPTTTGDFPAGDISFLQAIPAMGSKFIPARKSGPNGKAANANGAYTGRLVFSLRQKATAE